MGGSGQRLWKDTSSRGDHTCWLSVAGNPPALQAAVSALLRLQSGGACTHDVAFGCTMLAHAAKFLLQQAAVDAP